MMDLSQPPPVMALPSGRREVPQVALDDHRRIQPVAAMLVGLTPKLRAGPGCVGPIAPPHAERTQRPPLVRILPIRTLDLLKGAQEIGKGGCV